MNLEWINELSKWRSERLLTEYQDNIAEMIAEEIQELAEAKSQHEQIDALCDITVFITNAIGQLEMALYRNEPLVHIEISPFGMIQSFIKVYDKQYIDNLSKIAKLKDSKDKMKLFTELNKIYNDCIDIVEAMKYDFDCCMIEVVKEISSRQQDPTQKKKWKTYGVSGKWKKWKNQPKDTLYKANFELCKK